MQCAVLECRVFAGRAGNGFDEKPAMFEMYALATSITFCASDRRCSALGGYIASLTVTASRYDRSHSTNGRRFSGGPGPWVGQLTGATGTASELGPVQSGRAIQPGHSPQSPSASQSAGWVQYYSAVTGSGLLNRTALLRSARRQARPRWRSRQTHPQPTTDPKVWYAFLLSPGV